MLNGAKKKLSDYEEKDVIIMPSTKSMSGLINNVAFLMMFAIFLIAGYLIAFAVLIWGAWQAGLAIGLGIFATARLFDFMTKSTRKRKGYIKTTRNNARELILAEAAYAKLPKDDQAMYKGYLEGAYYGDATPRKVIEFFDHKLQEAHRNTIPKALDELMDMELPKE